MNFESDGPGWDPASGRHDLEADLYQAADEVKRLQRCVNDLLGILALPAMWTGGEPQLIMNTLLDSLMNILHLDAAYVWLNDYGDGPLELARSARSRTSATYAHEVGSALAGTLGNAPPHWPRGGRLRIGEEDLHWASFRLGLHGDAGVVVSMTQRENFPEAAEELLLSVAVNQAALGLQEARLRKEQRRTAEELDRRVVQRTAELEQRNAELRNEIAVRKKVEEKLRQEQEELKRSEVHKAAILDSSLDCIVAIDYEGRITEFNPAAERTFGYSRADVVGQQLADIIIPPSLREKHSKGFARYLDSGDGQVLGRRVEMTALCADRREIPVEIAITRVPLGGPPSFTGFLRDITDRRQNENALREAHAHIARSEERWRSVFENSAVGIALTDLSGLILAANPILQEMVGYTEAELKSLSFFQITREEHREINRRMLAELLAGKSRQFQIEKQYIRKDGRALWVRNHVSIVPGTERIPPSLMAIIEDITDRKRAEEALSQARSDLAHVTRVTTLGVLTASIAHEVNQPLAGIVTNASTCLRMLAADTPNLDGARETVRRTIRDANRAAQLITRLRAMFARKEASSELVDLNDAAKEVIALSMSDMQRDRVILDAEFSEDLPSVTGDRVQLQQVILNLLRNASDAMSTIDDRPRRLQIRTGHNDGHVRLSVHDAGIGIDPAEMDRLFQAFYTTKSNGMGIGLSVSRSIIENHHGRLWAAANEGPGTTFFFSIPCGPQGGAI